jgi:hypothetical protein
MAGAPAPMPAVLRVIVGSASDVTAVRQYHWVDAPAPLRSPYVCVRGIYRRC